MKRELHVTWTDPQETAHKARQMSGLEFLQDMIAGNISPPPVGKLLGFQLVEAAEGTATFKMNIAEYQYNPIGSVHGGVISTLLDSALGCAVQSTVDDQTMYTTTQLNINLVRPLTVAVGTVWCRGEVVHRGRRLATAEAQVTDKNGKVYAHASTTCFILSTAPQG